MELVKKLILVDSAASPFLPDTRFFKAVIDIAISCGIENEIPDFRFHCEASKIWWRYLSR